MLDLIYAVRSDETTHRFVNHSLANLNHNTDVNPFALREPDMYLKGTKIGYVCCSRDCTSILPSAPSCDPGSKERSLRVTSNSHRRYWRPMRTRVKSK